MKLLKILAELHWGYAIRRPVFSAAQPTVRAPPPTTLLGALARAYTTIKQIPEITTQGGRLFSSTIKLLEICPWATLALIDERLINPVIGPIETHDILKAVIAPYLRRENVYPGSAMLYGPQPHGKIYAPSMNVTLAYFVQDEYADELMRSAYGIVALGCKEAVVSIKEVHLVDFTEIHERMVKTAFYFPKKAGIPLSGGYVMDLFTLPKAEHFELAKVKDLSKLSEEFIIPLGSIEVQVSHEAAVVKDAEGDVLLIPREVMRGDK
ncbi:MAG: type I-A CRISPR-associated protein Cas5 [Thermoprotei archaeon]|nr:MAG: type I-A CRISPR-associated protein Cas5 [Thermoprotei archaeon]